ncbi:hypothetical protein JNUCC0626_39995 [Lentzea sp. JNUCC 0626]|uniref:hypothetical protein n=1 Tax=Lentzea sp. JNUCC 0626 TaxID=3367513 RepID=UPI003749761E
MHQLVTGTVWSESARQASELLMLCVDCHAALDGGEFDVAHVRSADSSFNVDHIGQAVTGLAGTLERTATHLNIDHIGQALADVADMLERTTSNLNVDHIGQAVTDVADMLERTTSNLNLDHVELALVTLAGVALVGRGDRSVTAFLKQRNDNPAVLIDPANYSRSSYDLEYSLSTATFNRWHHVGRNRWELVAELASQHDAGKASPAFLLTAARLASDAALDAWSAAVEVRQTYLSPATPLESRDHAVRKFACDWLGWKASVPEEKIEALVDALLSDAWPSAPDTDGPADVPTLLRGLVKDHYRNWRPYDVGQINGMSITSHSALVHTANGETVEMGDVLPGPDLDFTTEPRIMRVRNVLAELDPLEREVCLTYATCEGRKSWKRAARLNGLPDSFGENRVRRVIKTRLQGLQRT